MKVDAGLANSLSVLIVIILIALCPFEAFSKEVSAPPSSSSSGDSSGANEVRDAVFSGAWYPSDAKELARVVDGYINDAAKLAPQKGRLVGLVSPHAGFVYSGPVAGYGYELLKEQAQKPSTIILIGPSHRYRLSGVSVNNVEDYRTPLGVIENDRELSGQIIKASSGLFGYIPNAHAREHSLEAQLPFLQRSLPKGFKIVPILVNNTDHSEKLAAILTTILGIRDDVIVVASSDMSHYLPYDQAKQVDEQTLSIMEKLDVTGLERGLKSDKLKLCGGAAVLTLAKIGKRLGASKMLRLFAANSGDTGGSRETVVGYGSLAVFATASARKTKDGGNKVDGQLLSDEKRELLKIARDTIVEYVRNGHVPKVRPTSENLNMRRGAFVTIKMDGMLRGCIGRFSPVSEPLYAIVQEMAVAASTQDPRFRPVSLSETEDMDIEISVLSELKKIDDISEIKVGVHGIEIQKGHNRGVLLPQVATEQGWDRTEFLENTCRKASLPRDAYKKGAAIYIFSAQVFGEKD